MFRENVNNIRDFQVISNKNIKTVTYCLEKICHIRPFVCANLPADIKLATSLRNFKTKIKS